jgi:hypothetical protein
MYTRRHVHRKLGSLRPSMIVTLDLLTGHQGPPGGTGGVWVVKPNRSLHRTAAHAYFGDRIAAGAAGEPGRSALE